MAKRHATLEDDSTSQGQPTVAKTSIQDSFSDYFGTLSSQLPILWKYDRPKPRICEAKESMPEENEQFLRLMNLLAELKYLKSHKDSITNPLVPSDKVILDGLTYMSGFKDHGMAVNHFSEEIVKEMKHLSTTDERMSQVFKLITSDSRHPWS